jgi:CRP/FNR family transcriptional regulator, cyclic AMP receptor protein
MAKKPSPVSGARIMKEGMGKKVSEPRKAARLAGASQFDANSLFSTAGIGRSIMKFQRNSTIFRQGDPADAVFYIQSGRIELKVVSERGKAAITAILGPGDFFGEGCLASQTFHFGSAIALAESAIVRIEKESMIRMLRDEPDFSSLFTTFLLSRNIQFEEDLVDQLFNSSERRLARVLLLLANFGKNGELEPVIPRISQEVLAEKVGTTRPRISAFMNKFRKLGFIEYNGRLKVNRGLLNIVASEDRRAIHKR